MEIKVKPKSFQYDVRVRWSAEKRGVLRAEGRPDLEVASPPEFRGHPGLWTPEHLLVAAVNACTMLTFLSAVARSGIRLISYDCDATGTLEHAEGTFRFTKVVLRPRIIVAGPDDIDRAHAAFRDAEGSCLVSNSLLTKVESRPEISAGD
ncbi:MAG TPA: OsmC family protein [Candidatus Polarisedimenticolia bacterium]|nr:OsmC family protein [Candidatus Polarisedimenticolia bacterium]